MLEPDFFEIIHRIRPKFIPFAACKGKDPNLFHPGPGKQHDLQRALAICKGCDVRRECFIYAMEGDERYGVWGGTSARQRIDWLDLKVLPEDAWEEIIGLRKASPNRRQLLKNAKLAKAEVIEDNGRIKAKIRAPKRAGHSA